MLRRRLDAERHGSDGFTTLPRVICIGFVVGFLVLATHMAVTAEYDGRIMPGVVVAGRDLSGLTLAQARAVVQKLAASYRLKLNVAGQHYEASAVDLGVAFDPEATVESAYAVGRGGWLPPLHSDPISLSYHLNRSQLNAFASSVADKVGTPPVDAGVVVKNGQVTTVPEKSGWSIDRVGLERLVEDDVSAVDGDALALQPREQLADIQVKSLGPTIDEAKHLMATPIVLTYKDQTFTPTPADIGQWLAFQKQPDGLAFKLVPQVDTAKLKNYIQNLANQLDVSPINEKDTIENGVKKVEQPGVNGTAIDQDPITAAVAEAVAQEKPLTYAIVDHSVAYKTISTNLVSLDLGRYIEVNLTKQHLWVWQDHNVIYDSPITSGATGAGLGTVTGLFSIYYKTTNTHLVGYQYGYNYDVPVKYWMPFYEGYGLHDASWRNGNFGETSGPLGYWYDGSHGCVNLPDATAAFIYNWSTVGTPVWVHN